MGDRKKFAVALGLVIYLSFAGIMSVLVVISSFPLVSDGTLTFPTEGMGGPILSWFAAAQSPERGLLVLAFFGGLAGSFLHAAQSLASYLGNTKFKLSWTVWYLLRPLIGGVLGFALYFAMRAGLVQGSDSPDPYGVVALGLLGGWFSKTTTDKLQEVYGTLFKTDADKERKDKLDSEDGMIPVIEKVDPSEIMPDVAVLEITGEGFTKDSKVEIDEQQLTPEYVSENLLKVDLGALEKRPAAKDAALRVLNPGHSDRFSEKVALVFKKAE